MEEIQRLIECGLAKIRAAEQESIKREAELDAQREENRKQMLDKLSQDIYAQLPDGCLADYISWEDPPQWTYSVTVQVDVPGCTTIGLTFHPTPQRDGWKWNGSYVLQMATGIRDSRYGAQPVIRYEEAQETKLDIALAKAVKAKLDEGHYQAELDELLKTRAAEEEEYERQETESYAAYQAQAKEEAKAEADRMSALTRIVAQDPVIAAVVKLMVAVQEERDLMQECLMAADERLDRAAQTWEERLERASKEEQRLIRDLDDAKRAKLAAEMRADEEERKRKRGQTW